MDFGIARAVADAQATMTQGNAVMEPPSTCPRAGARRTRRRLFRPVLRGLSVLRTAHRTAPFHRESAVSPVAYQHVSEQPVAPSLVDPAVPPASTAWS